MEDKIEVGEWVRNREGKIDKVINTDYYMNQYIECEKLLILRKSIVKHSKNKIDLVEVGDYVNGAEVLDIYKPRELWEQIEIRVNDKYTNFIISDDIKTIVTHEQFKEREYIF